MNASVLFSPTKAFEDAFHNENAKGALGIVLLTSLFLAIAGYLVLGNVFASAYLAVGNIIQWFVLAFFVWFFEFIHVRKKKHLVGVSFYQCLSVVGKLWTISLISAIIFVLTAFLTLLFGSGITIFLAVLLLLSTVVLTIAWLVASFKLIKVVLGVEKWKLVLNWIIINILYVITTGILLTIL